MPKPKKDAKIAGAKKTSSADEPLRIRRTCYKCGGPITTAKTLQPERLVNGSGKGRMAYRHTACPKPTAASTEE